MARLIALAALAASCGLVAAQAAAAQSSPPPPSTSKQTIPEKDPALRSRTAASGSVKLKKGRSVNLSQKLSRSNGVISPPSGIDPGIETTAPAPHPNSTPVIPPPSATGRGPQAK